MSAGASLQLAGVSSGYGVVTVLRDISLEVGSGEVATVLGANGAGKSTLLKTAVGLLTPSSGSVRIGGDDVTALTPEAIVRRGAVLVPEGRQLFAEMTVREHLLLGSFIHRRRRDVRKREMGRVLELFPVLADRMNASVADLSGGQQQMVAIGRALMARPSLLLLDEPSLGLAPLVTREVFDNLAALRDTGVTMLIIEQKAMMALELADRAYVLDRGQLVAEGSAAELKADERVRSAYLGLGEPRTDERTATEADDPHPSSGAEPGG